MNADDLIRLRHMRDAGLTARRIVRGKQRESLDDDEMIVLALCRVIEIIGEAASKVSNPTRAANPTIPWAQIVAMRNRLIHAYFDIDLDQVWGAVAEDIPILIAQLEKIIPPLEPPQGS
jgi:uncharacterized protein with HEPN domain